MDPKDTDDNDYMIDDSLDADESPRSKLGLIGLAAGVLGLALGVAALITANGASKSLAELQEQLEARPDPVPDLQAQLEDMDQRLVSLGSEIVRLGRVDRQIRDEVQSALDRIGRDVGQNRQMVNETTQRLREFMEAVESRRAPVAAAPAAQEERPQRDRSDDAAAPSRDGLNEDGTYTIQSGDTMSSIAQRYGLSLSRLLNANPGVNPRALQIGQRIVIPRD